MALTQTTLAAAASKKDIEFHVTSSTGATVNGLMRVNGEWSYITEIVGNLVKVRGRGSLGGIAEDQAILSVVTFGLAADFDLQGPADRLPDPQADEDRITVSVDGAIPLPQRNTRVVIKKATAAALTLAAPTTAMDDMKLTIVSDTAAAHTVTYTPGFSRNTTASDLATFTAVANAGMVLRARSGTWAIESLHNVAIT